jgi:hypothetical protein
MERRVELKRALGSIKLSLNKQKRGYTKDKMSKEEIWLE